MMPTPVVVDMPLRGEWVTPNTPGTRVPSHGIDILGETFAYDFVRLGPGPTGTRFYKTNPLSYLVLGVQLKDCYGWGQPILSATDGVVVESYDGMPERNPVHLLRDVAVQFKNARTFTNPQTAHVQQNADLRQLAGNYVLVESVEGYALYAHAQNGSVKVTRGDKVKRGQHLANVGHSGNSTAPHLHFHLMDRQDPWRAKGILCAFRDYQVLQGGEWHTVQNGIPTDKDRIRKL